MCEGLVLCARVWFRVRGSSSVCEGLVPCARVWFHEICVQGSGSVCEVCVQGSSSVCKGLVPCEDLVPCVRV